MRSEFGGRDTPSRLLVIFIERSDFPVHFPKAKPPRSSSCAILNPCRARGSHPLTRGQRRPPIVLPPLVLPFEIALCPGPAGALTGSGVCDDQQPCGFPPWLRERLRHPGVLTGRDGLLQRTRPASPGTDSSCTRPGGQGVVGEEPFPTHAVEKMNTKPLSYHGRCKSRCPRGHCVRSADLI